MGYCCRSKKEVKPSPKSSSAMRTPYSRIAAMFFISIFVMFTALHLDMKHSRLYREVQMLRERSTRLQEQRFRRTTHSAIVEELKRRGIDLQDPTTPAEPIE